MDFTQLLHDYGPALMRLTAGYTADPADRDDLLQEILVAIWTAWPRFRGECSERTFVFRIGHNRAITFVTRRRQLEPLEAALLVPDPGPGPVEDAERADRQAQLLAAVRQLPALQRQAVMLSLEGLTQREIADVVGTSENNVAVRLTRARAALRVHFAQGIDR
jgi:RNA polymerase sigma-70 factor (ECF subfamily)